MADEYHYVPKASNAIVKVALVAATLKTALQVATPSTMDLLILGWGVSFDSAAAGGEAQVELIDTDVAATVTALTPEKWGDPNAPASLAPGGAALTGYNATAEGTIAASRIIDSQLVNIQTGYAVWFAPDARPRVAVSRFLRVRANSPAGVNVIPWIVGRE